MCKNCPPCCKNKLDSSTPVKEHLTHFAAGSLRCPQCSRSRIGLDHLILHFNVHDVQCWDEEKRVRGIREEAESHIVNAGTKTNYDRKRQIMQYH